MTEPGKFTLQTEPFVITDEEKQVQERMRSPVGIRRKPVVVAPKIGRNEKCPCGSGKKYKHCCLKKHE